jgi:peptidoglycan/LPS O-acetylase OafA/YrhL
LADLTRSNSGERPLSSSAVFSVLLGLVAVATLPAAILFAERGDRITLLESSVAIAPAFVLGLMAVVLGRRARNAIDRTLGRMKGSKLAGLGRFLGYLTLYMAVTATISVATYYVLRRIA